MLLITFQVKQSTFVLQTAGISRQFPAGTDHPVAGNDNGDRVARVGAADRTNRFGITNRTGDILVASGFAVWYLKQCIPYLALEGCTLWRKIQ